jgi:hypothetical protein
VYQWFVFTHVVGLVLFVLAHGASAFAAFRIRTLRDAGEVAGYLAFSQQAVRASYIGLLLLLLGGAAAATTNDRWGELWVWSSVIVLVVVLVAMWAVGASYYYKLRDLLAGKDGQEPLAGEALTAYLDSRRPEILAAVGGVGLLVLVWLMVLKPI